MSDKTRLRKTRAGTVINTTSKRQDATLLNAVFNVCDFLEGTQFNRGTFYFRVPEWTQAEMEARCLPIAERSIYYYFSKYGKQAFVP